MSPAHREIFEQGVESWNSWRKANPGVVPDLSGIDASESDLTGFNLSGASLNGADLFGADLRNANMKQADLREADLSGAKLCGADLYKCAFGEAFLTAADLSSAYAGAANFRGTDMRGVCFEDANLTEADFRGARLSAARFLRSDLTRCDLTGADLRHVDFSDAHLVETSYGNSRTRRGNFFGVRGLESSSGNALFVRDAKDQDYLDTMELQIRQMPRGLAKTVKTAFFEAWGLIDFGRTLIAPVIYAAALVLAFGLVFALDMYLGWGLFNYEGTSRSWVTPFYYSVVTYTTLGYGDVTPTHLIGEVLVVVEVILGYMTLGLVLSILANKVARRS